ncbi:hypothetical protein Taro_039363, partial [Colocasia esculenta]|nr:hypothetical protein [Colocasia esculenta]
LQRATTSPAMGNDVLDRQQVVMGASTEEEGNGEKWARSEILGDTEDNQELVHTDSEREDMETMATRGRRGAGPTRGDESAGGSQAPAQQAQDQTCVPLPPPPPPVDYGALMQGLVHAMQTQAQTTMALQAQVQVQAQAPAHEAGFGGVSIMERFRRMTPPLFKGESDPILAESWLRETKKIFRSIRCAEEERVTLATYMLQEAEMEVYLEEKRASLKRPGSAFQRQDRQKKAPAFQQRAVVPARVAAPTPGGDKVAEKPLCTQCGKCHGGEVCWVTSGRCLRCGDKNHKIRDCPKMAQQTTAATTRQVPRAAGRPRA